MSQFDFKKFWQALSTDERKRLAEDAGTTTNYIKVHLIYSRRMPNKDLMNSLYEACRVHDPELSKESFIGFFYASA